MNRRNIIIIAGPTGVGKTATSIALAKKMNGEIISADSMQIYKTMDIGTAKVNKEEMEGIPHHLIDVVDPNENFSVSDFESKASMIINDIFNRGKIPIIVGGTGLYINSLIYKMDYHDVKVDEKLRNDLWNFYETNGAEELYQKLLNLDPNTSVEKNNTKRVIRAIEILSTNSHQNAFTNLEKRTDFSYSLFILQRDRKKLYKLIDDRVELMITQGLLEEVSRLIDLGLTKNSQSIKAIGYRQLYDYFKGEISIEVAIDLIKRDSRRYAKRQLTWFKRYKDGNWIDVDDLDILKILEIILKTLDIDKK